MPENPYDEANVRSHDIFCHAKLERARVNPEHFTLTLSVCDGPETFADFDPAENVDPDGECSLTVAITTAVNRLIGAAREDEAGRWISDHEEVFIVVGKTGQGPDAQSWNVGAFVSEERAFAACRSLNMWCFTNQIHPQGDRTTSIIDPTGSVVKHPEDPNFRIDGGTEYEIVKTPLDMFDPIGD
jgi:hypothetical protein